MTKNTSIQQSAANIPRSVTILCLCLGLTACGIVTAEESPDERSAKQDVQEASDREDTSNMSRMLDASSTPSKRVANLEPFVLEVRQDEFGTLAEAQEQADFELLWPAYLPDGFSFQKGWLSEFAIEYPPPAVTMMVFANDQDSFTLVQGTQDSLVVPLPTGGAVRDDAQRGEVEIQGVTAEWVRGAYITQNPDSQSHNNGMRWDESQLQLYWEKDEYKYSLESRSLELSELVQIADALE